MGAIIACCQQKSIEHEIDYIEHEIGTVLRKIGSPYLSKEANLDESKIECPICIDEVNTEAVTTLCKHTMHHACLVQYWKTTYPVMKCPVCRFQFGAT